MVKYRQCRGFSSVGLVDVKLSVTWPQRGGKTEGVGKGKGKRTRQGKRQGKKEKEQEKEKYKEKEREVKGKGREGKGRQGRKEGRNKERKDEKNREIMQQNTAFSSSDNLWCIRVHDCMEGVSVLACYDVHTHGTRSQSACALHGGKDEGRSLDLISRSKRCWPRSF